jgi:hypothetical protein
MMMKILETAGVQTLTDNIRQADKDNVLGYYEYEPVKRIEFENSWLGKAEGKAVKIVSPLLAKIDPSRRYKVIFMERKIEEILASQKKMMERKGSPDSVSDKEMKNIYMIHLDEIKEWLERQQNIETMYIDYNLVLEDPEPWVAKLQEFLGLDNIIDKMTATIKKDLYRQRK